MNSTFTFYEYVAVEGLSSWYIIPKEKRTDYRHYVTKFTHEDLSESEEKELWVKFDEEFGKYEGKRDKVYIIAETKEAEPVKNSSELLYL